MAEITRIFLSSVSGGLERHREAVHQALSIVGWIKCVRMEDFGARNQSSLATCKTQLADCDVMFAIAGPRYGSIERRSNKSYCEVEYNHAKELGIPIFAFLTESNFQIDQDLIEADELRVRQHEFRRVLERERQVAYFSTPEDLKDQANSAIHNNSALFGRQDVSQPSHPEATHSGLHLIGRDQHLHSQRPIVEAPTILIFPFVTNQAGFDTGVVVTNASAGPFYDQPHSGQCRISYFGCTAGGGRAPNPQVSGLVEPGSQLVLTMSNGGNAGIIATPGFQGYLVVECGFYPCYGWAFISGLGGKGVASSYLAQMVSKPPGVSAQWATGSPPQFPKIETTNLE